MFKKGTSGNPAGRPHGTGSRQKLFNDLVLPYKDQLVSKALEMALNGSEKIMSVFLDRLLPYKRDDESDEHRDEIIEELKNLRKQLAEQHRKDY